MLAYTYYNALETPTITEKLSSVKDQGRIIHEAGETEAWARALSGAVQRPPGTTLPQATNKIYKVGHFWPLNF